MALINADLLERLKEKLKVQQSQVYKLIDAKVRSTHLPRPLAAIALASERGINISRFASEVDLATIRQAAMSAAPSPVVVQSASAARPASTQKARTRRSPKQPPRRGNTVFVVHGRNTLARDAMFALLRACALRPLEWSQALKLTKKGSPYVGDVLEAAFSEECKRTCDHTIPRNFGFIARHGRSPSLR